ncbi:MAG: NADH-quinone oxidoreductase subunit C [Nitrospinota bacterium]
MAEPEAPAPEAGQGGPEGKGREPSGAVPGEDVVRALAEAAPGALEERYDFKGREDEVTLLIRRAEIVRVCQYLKEAPPFQFDFLTDLCGAHYLDEERPFQVVYHLYSFPHNRRLRLKVKVGEDEPVPSLTGVWGSANWFEREAYDLFGIRFQGHPDLRRILMPPDWPTHPLRKDYPLAGMGERVYTKPRRKGIGE